MLYTVHLKEVICHTVRIELSSKADAADLYSMAVEMICPDTIVDSTVKEEAIFIGDTHNSLQEELNIWCNQRGLVQESADDLLSNPTLSKLEVAYLELFIQRWDALT